MRNFAVSRALGRTEDEFEQVRGALQNLINVAEVADMGKPRGVQEYNGALTALVAHSVSVQGRMLETLRALVEVSDV